MEYRKSAEEVRTSLEYKKVSAEQQTPAKEYFTEAHEYHAPAKEYFLGEEATEKTKELAKKQNRAGLMKKVRQMGYLVAASVAVVTVAQTVEPAIPSDNENQDVVAGGSVLNSGDIAINVPGLEGFYDDTSGSEVSDENNMKNEYLAVSSYEKYSTANGGVFLIRENGMMGLMSLSGEVLCEPKYNGTDWHAPNDDGYSVVDSDGIYYVLDNKGNEVFVWDEPSEDIEVRITDNNIIFIEQYGNFENDALAKVSYWRTDGTKVAEITSMGAEIFEANAFNDGIAMINMSTETAWDAPHMLHEDGTLQQLLDSEGNTPYFWVSDGAYADGYYVGFSAEGWSLVDVATGKGMGAFWPLNVVSRYVPEFLCEDTTFKGYFEDGQYLYNYGTYGCLEAVNSEEKVCMLFDYRDANGSDYNLDRVIAIYDTIVMDDFQYLLASQDGFCFYINWDGEVVSEKYTDATAFNEDGYAMIMPEEGTAYLINNRFEKLDTIDYVFSVGNCGDAFEMNRLGEDVIYVP